MTFQYGRPAPWDFNASGVTSRWRFLWEARFGCIISPFFVPATVTTDFAIKDLLHNRPVDFISGGGGQPTRGYDRRLGGHFIEYRDSARSHTVVGAASTDLDQYPIVMAALLIMEDNGTNERSIGGTSSTTTNTAELRLNADSPSTGNESFSMWGRKGTASRSVNVTNPYVDGDLVAMAGYVNASLEAGIAIHNLTQNTRAKNYSADLDHGQAGTAGDGNITINLGEGGKGADQGIAYFIVAQYVQGDMSMIMELVDDPWGPFRQDDSAVGFVVAAGDVTVTPGVATLTITAFAPTVQATDHQTVAPGFATLTLTAFAPTIGVTDHITVAPGLATLSLTAFAPTIGVTDHQTVAPGVATLSITAFAPTVVATGDVTVTPGVSSLTLTAFAPTIGVSDHQTVTPGVAALTLTAFAPTVALTDNLTITPGAAALSLSAFAPTVQATDHITVAPGVASLTMTAFAPTIAIGVFIVAPIDGGVAVPTLDYGGGVDAPTLDYGGGVAPPTIDRGGGTDAPSFE